jgi:hypothetical protein
MATLLKRVIQFTRVPVLSQMAPSDCVNGRPISGKKANPPEAAPSSCDTCDKSLGQMKPRACTSGLDGAGNGSLSRRFRASLAGRKLSRARSRARCRRHQIVHPLVHNELSIEFGAMLDDEHPDVGIVGQPVPKLRRFVQPRVALLLNHGGSVCDGVLNQLHHVGFRLVRVSRGVVV